MLQNLLRLLHTQPRKPSRVPKDILSEVRAGKTPATVSHSGMLRGAIHREGPRAAGYRVWLVTHL